MSPKYNKDMPLKKITIKCKRIKQKKDQFKHSDSVKQRINKPCAGVYCVLPCAMGVQCVEYSILDSRVIDC